MGCDDLAVEQIHTYDGPFLRCSGAEEAVL
jgi:hypothetical protein